MKKNIQDSKTQNLKELNLLLKKVGELYQRILLKKLLTTQEKTIG